ncbi:muconolactone Delta-isomerase [Kocuria sp. JC486]|uniref:Muconolactone Delta-isomerase n=1 Tax=Kocuria soli TaxID=2485125 RepID=A0A3N3ZRB7_9MICC|nr:MULTISPECIES: muconolactone Delta-isomerase [Kocuria]NHU84019.1 muconolactone Delta-isomerase [Kocuria sp. JC486]ROZ63796.1 muconolactone Delta-isomerase [Kocuria soli]
MKFLCRMQVQFPESMSAEEVAQKQAQEKEYSQALQRSGEFEAIYRVVGKYANVSIFDVESNDRLHEILSGFPMFPYMSIETTPLSKHPNSIR